MGARESLASSKYELCAPVASRLWALKSLGALIAGVLMHDDLGYGGGSRSRVRERTSGAYVYEVKTSVKGLDAHEAQLSISRDLERMTISEFERSYGINGDPASRSNPT